MDNEKKRPAYDVNIKGDPKPDGKGFYWTKVGAAWDNDGALTITLKFPVGVKELHLFPLKKKTSDDGQQ